MIIIENRTVPCNPRSKNYAKGTVVNVSGSASMPTFVYTPTYDDIINALKNGKDYITIPTILEVYGDLYSLGEVSAFGAGSGGSSGGGLIQTVHDYSSLGGTFNNDTLTDTFNAYTINQLHLRLSQVEVGAAVNVAVSGAGNAITGVTKNGDVLEFTKGLTFSLASHTHDYIPLSQKGTANGVASLDANGLIISAQLPSYIDDIIEVSSYSNLPAVGSSGKIYVTTNDNITYRWTGTTYVEISKSIALGETSSTAYRGDLGAIAYAHSQIAGGTGIHVSSTERTNWNLAYTNNHTHANKSLLDAFSQSDNDVLDHLSVVNGKLKVDIDLRSGWFRSDGTTGWINDTYGGGIYMTDTTYVKVYNNKSFWVDNNIVATGEITAFGASDIRLKSNIKQIDSALDFLSKVKTYEFDWNEKALSLNPLKTKKGAGVIAQELNLLDNNFVHSIYGDYLGVDYERFIPYLIGGVNEVADEVTILKKRVAELELEVKRLSA